MNNSDSFDRKSFRKAKFESKKKNRKDFLSSNRDEHRLAKISKQNIKQKKREIEEEEKWEEWENYN